MLLWSMICGSGRCCGGQIMRWKSVVGWTYGSTQGFRGNKNGFLHAYSHTYMRTMSMLHLTFV